MDITSKDIKRISDIAMMQSGIYMKSDPTGDIKYLQVKDINRGVNLITVGSLQWWIGGLVTNTGYGKMIYCLRLKEPLIIVFCMMG